MEKPINGTVQFFGQPEDGFEEFIRSQLERWIKLERRAMNLEARFQVRISYLTFPTSVKSELVACEIEVILGHRTYKGRDMAAEPRRALRRTIDHLSPVRSGHEPSTDKSQPAI